MKTCYMCGQPWEGNSCDNINVCDDCSKVTASPVASTITPLKPTLEDVPENDFGCYRDEIAVRAMQSQIAFEGMEGCDKEHVCAMAYEMADAMLKARKAGV